MKFAKPVLVSFSLLAFASASAFAAGDATDKSASQAKPSMSSSASAGSDQSASGGASSAKSGQSKMSRGETRASELIGTDVTNTQGEDLGEIKDVVINLLGGKVHAAVLEFGGILGMGEKQYAFPISQLKPGKDDKVVLNLDKEKLKNAEGFAQNQWPAMNDEYWGRVGGRASAGATKGQAQKMNLVRASEMMGKEVQSKAGKDIGEIRDMTISLKDGSLKNIVLDVQDAGQAMVQAKSLTAGTGDKLVINMTEEQLRSQAKKSQGAAGGSFSTGTPTTGKTATDPSPRNK